jgi:very-short-patch-repair endonuclease
MDSMKNKNLSELARSLRKNMTRHERHLWYDFLKGLPMMVHRQKVIGSYIVDFYIAEKKLVIELDGSQHYDLPGKQADAARDAFLTEQNLTVLRYANSDIDKNFRGVCEDILSHLE